MHFTFTALASAVLVALHAVNSVSGGIVLKHRSVVTDQDILDWIATTDANLTFIGDPFTKRAAQDTRVVYCSRRSKNVCGGTCTVYSGNSKCLPAPNTDCLSATTNVAFCDRENCGGSCNQLDSCGTKLDNSFCYTPGTKSINVPFT